MSSIDVAVDEYTIQVSVENPVILVQTSGPPGPPGTGGGGGGLDQGTADALYVKLTGASDQAMESGLDVGGILSAAAFYTPGAITTEDHLAADSMQLLNDDRSQRALIIHRLDPAQSTEDADIFVIYNGGGSTDNDRASWANEKGQWRTSNVTAPAEDALKVIGSNAVQGNVASFIKQDGTIFVRVGANGTLIAELGLRLVAGAAAGRVLVGDSSGNATWQVVPVATGAAPPASPYVGQLWSDPA